MAVLIPPCVVDALVFGVDDPPEESVLLENLVVVPAGLVSSVDEFARRPDRQKWRVRRTLGEDWYLMRERW